MDDVKLMDTVIIVEDDEYIGYLLEFILQREGFKTLHALDGRVAERLFESTALPRLILLDVMLPYQDGFQLIKIIRSKPDWHKVPVIMLTAKSQEQDIVRALEMGADDYIVKPFQPNELLADDYIVKPFQPNELLARVRRLLRMVT